MSNNKDFKVKNGIQPTVYHEGLGTVVSGSESYYLAGASYDSVSFSVSSQDSNPRDLTFNADGTKMFVVSGNTSAAYQYSLSTAFDLSTASYDSVSFSVNSQDGSPYGIHFNTDGTRMYMAGDSSNSVYQYTLSTGFDLSTASYSNVSFNVNSQDGNPYGMSFNTDGTKMYIAGGANDTVFQYSLSTGFDLSTASYSSVSLNVGSQDTVPTGLDFNSNGTKMYLLGLTNDTVFQYSLSTGFDLSTASYDSISFSVTSQDPVPVAIRFNNDGTKIYMIGAGNDNIYQYSTALTTAQLDLSTGSVFDYTPTSDIQVTLSNPADSGTVSGATLLLDGGGSAGYDLSNAAYADKSFSFASQETDPQGLTLSSDGTKMYVLGVSSDTVYQYSLSTAFDVSTASYDSVSFSVSSQETVPTGLKFKSDGSKLFVVGQTTDAVYQYSLSTSFDLSTASYDSVSFSLSSQTTGPNDIAFNTNGTKMYTIAWDGSTIRVFQYSLSTGFDLSTVSYDSISFDVGNEEFDGRDLAFNSTGTKMFVVGSAGDAIFQYSLSTAFDLSSASYDSISFSVRTQATSPQALSFKGDGTKVYICDATTDTVYQYNTVTPATITYDPTLEWSGGTAPTAPAIGETDVVTFNTRDGGSTYQGVLAIDGAK